VTPVGPATITDALIFNSLVKHPRSSLLLSMLYKSSYLQLQLQDDQRIEEDEAR